MTMLAQEIVRAKRDGAVLREDEIDAFVAGLAGGAVSEAQAAAFAMAVFFRGLDKSECVALTQAMMRSGAVLDWSDPGLAGPVLDKHSTGGIGDAVSLVLAPAIAACGGFVPMIAGRGLGHTGGTVDKLEAIPGYETSPERQAFRALVAEAGCAIIGQTDDLAPADRRLYAIRDVTATVESVPLITASILAKKLAAGLDALVLDVKTGSGAFMACRERARELAESLVEVARGAGLATSALITDMDQPLASAAGNALEMRLVIDHLTGAHVEARLHEAVLALGAEMLVLGGLAADKEAGREAVARALAEGRAAERFARMVAGLGGPADLLERPDAYLAAAPVRRAAEPEGAGVVSGIDTRMLGLAVVSLGGGRRRPDDAVDPAVGLSDLAPLGAEIGPGRPLARIHAASEADAAAATGLLRSAYRLAEPGGKSEAGPVVIERVGD